MGKSWNDPQVGHTPSIYNVGPGTPRGSCAHQDTLPFGLGIWDAVLE